MILAKNLKTGVQLTFDSLKLFNMANQTGLYELIEGGVPPQPQSIEDIPYKVLDPVDDFSYDTSEVTVKEFRELLTVYTLEELELFANDPRATVSKRAKTRIIQLKKQ